MRSSLSRSPDHALPAADTTQKKTHGEADVPLSLRPIQHISGHDDACGATHHKAQKGSRGASRFGHVDFALDVVTHEQITEKADSRTGAFFEGGGEELREAVGLGAENALQLCCDGCGQIRNSQ